MKNKDLLSKFDFFSDIPQDKIEEIEQQCDILEFKVNDFIFRINKSAECLFGVISGQVELFITFMDKGIYKTQKGDKSLDAPQFKILQTPIIVDTIRPGEIFGWSSMLNHQNWTANAKCIVPTRIFSLPAPFLKDILQKDAVVGFNIMERLCDLVLRRLQARTDSMFESKINALGRMLNFTN